MSSIEPNLHDRISHIVRDEIAAFSKSHIEAAQISLTDRLSDLLESLDLIEIMMEIGHDCDELPELRHHENNFTLHEEGLDRNTTVYDLIEHTYDAVHACITQLNGKQNRNR